MLLLAPIYWAFERSGHHDWFKRFEVLITVVVVIPASYPIMEGIERLSFGRRDREPLTPFLKATIAIGAVAAVAFAIFDAW